MSLEKSNDKFGENFFITLKNFYTYSSQNLSLTDTLSLYTLTGSTIGLESLWYNTIGSSTTLYGRGRKEKQNLSQVSFTFIYT